MNLDFFIYFMIFQNFQNVFIYYKDQFSFNLICYESILIYYTSAIKIWSIPIVSVSPYCYWKMWTKAKAKSFMSAWRKIICENGYKRWRRSLLHAGLHRSAFTHKTRAKKGLTQRTNSTTQSH